MIAYDLSSPAAIVRKAEAPAPAIPVSDDPQVAAMQLRAEQAVAGLSLFEVMAYEAERVAVRKGYGLDPAPLTSRGLAAVTALRYSVGPDGFLTLG